MSGLARLFTTLMAVGPIVAMGVAVANAEPVVKPGGKPGAATAWTGTGKSTTLSIGSEFSAEDVAKAIAAGVAGTTAKAKGDKVIVSGLSMAELLTALEKVEVEPSLDDIDAMLSALQSPTTEEGSGSSIRATKSADFADVMGGDQDQVSARVLSVKRDRFPLVFVTVQIETFPKESKSLGLKKGQRITVVPRVKSKNGLIDPDDKASKLNVGAWYAQPGDRVRIRLEEERKKVWIAAGFDRTALAPK